MSLLEVENVVKEYKAGVRANDNHFLSVEAGEVYGLGDLLPVRVDADAAIVMFSPQREHTHVIDHMIEMTKA